MGLVWDSAAAADAPADPTTMALLPAQQINSECAFTVTHVAQIVE